MKRRIRVRKRVRVRVRKGISRASIKLYLIKSYIRNNRDSLDIPKDTQDEYNSLSDSAKESEENKVIDNVLGDE